MWREANPVASAFLARLPPGLYPYTEQTTIDDVLWYHIQDMGWIVGESPVGVNIYANLFHVFSTSEDELTRAIIESLQVWAGYTYAQTDAQIDYPEGLVYAPSSYVDTGTKGINCSTFTWATCNFLYPDAAWDKAVYLDWQVINKTPWGAIEQARKLGIAEPGDYVTHKSPRAAKVDGWYLGQKWTDPENCQGGHSFFVWATPEGLYQLEATRFRTHDGVVFRNIGPALGDPSKPPPFNWDEVLLQAPYVRLVKLIG